MRTSRRIWGRPSSIGLPPLTASKRLPTTRSAAGSCSLRTPGASTGAGESVIAMLAFGMLVAAFGYAAVGHGGASAYIAAMALAGIAPAEMRPVALLLNVMVSALATY